MHCRRIETAPPESRCRFSNVLRAALLVIAAQSPGFAKAGTGNPFSLMFWFPVCAGMTCLEYREFIQGLIRRGGEFFTESDQRSE